VSAEQLARIELEVDGLAHQLELAPLRRLLDVLREDLGLTGTKEGCGEGECGACTVLVDGQALNSCLVPAIQADGARITTVASAQNEAVQEAFVECEGSQCGICTPGLIVMTRAWIERCRRDDERPTRAGARSALAGNLCRCTGYEKVIDAALQAAARAGLVEGEA